MSLPRTALLAAGLLTITLAAQAEFESWRLSEAPPELRPAISRADLVIVGIQDAVLRELDDALAHRGPAGAISSCHLDATALTERIARYEGLAAGRTSDRLRNPTNAPRPW